MRGSDEKRVALLAHSADRKRGIPPQDYVGHVDGVVRRARERANDVAVFSRNNGDALRAAVDLAAEFHDLGKIDDNNQDVLHGRTNARKLPVQHTEAGTARLLKWGASHAATLVRSHHIGLPDFIEEANRLEGEVLRDSDRLLREHVESTLSELLRQHAEVCRRNHRTDQQAPIDVIGDPALFFRIALSCLADGDHTDTSVHYREFIESENVPLWPDERLDALNRYVDTLVKDNERSRMRTSVYSACRDATPDGPIVSCDSPVGTGKTTSIMAHLLAQAQKRGLRRIIVVLPYTSIISQSVKVYREALVLPGENPELVVAELHHRAEYQDVHSRQLTALWNAPVIVTTAVGFFETLASNRPSTLRRLHNLPGSAVFVDESHAALPAKLLPLAWRWIKEYAYEWGCYWVLASGSLNRFWQIEEFDAKPPIIPELITVKLREKLASYEDDRVSYKFNGRRMAAPELVQFVAELPGPRIVILNTVQSTAAIALEYKNRFGRGKVEHLSTALTPQDRDTTLSRVRKRLADKTDNNWSLIATSCVEAGVDISFRSGVREAASLVSLLQISGRVNRHGQDSDTVVWTIQIQDRGLLKEHPGMHVSSQVLLEFFAQDKTVSPHLCTEALQREIRLEGQFPHVLTEWESQLRFPKVEEAFQVIASDTRTVVVDHDIVSRIENYEQVNWRDIQKASVQIWGYRLDALRIPEMHGRPGLYKWGLAYDTFLGYMAGVLQVESIVLGIGSSCVV